MRLKFVLLCLLGPAWTTFSSGHPGSLDEYPERFAGKTLQAILREWEPPPEKSWSEIDLLNGVENLADDWLKLSSDELKKRILSLLEENRRGDYRKRFANVLIDMHALLGSGEAGRSEEAADYLRWRMDHLNSDDGFFDEIAHRQWDDTKQQI
jgi:hypothetical protein